MTRRRRAAPEDAIDASLETMARSIAADVGKEGAEAPSLEQKVSAFRALCAYRALKARLAAPPAPPESSDKAAFTDLTDRLSPFARHGEDPVPDHRRGAHAGNGADFDF